MKILQAIGRPTLGFLGAISRITVFSATAPLHTVRPPFDPRIIGRQMLEIGYFSLPVVGLTAVFAGMVPALQSFTGFARFRAEGAIAKLVVLSIIRELGPVLAGLMVSGQSGRTSLSACSPNRKAAIAPRTSRFPYWRWSDCTSLRSWHWGLRSCRGRVRAARRRSADSQDAPWRPIADPVFGRRQVDAAAS